MGRFRENGGISGRFRTGRSYWQQAVTKKEYCVISIKAAGIAFITGWLFYHEFWSFFIVSPFGIWLFKYLEKEKTEQKKSEFLMQFKEMTESVASALNVGYSAENALKEAGKEMKILYSDTAIINKELEVIVRKIRLQIPMEQILYEFAERVELEDVKNFSTVFAAAKRSGGDMIAIIRNTASQIGEKIDVKREIDIILAAKRFEFKIMCVIPYAMIMYMQLSYPEFMQSLYGNVIGIGVMSACLGAYVSACILGARLIKIEV